VNFDELLELARFSMSPLEIVVRGSVVYWMLFLLFRFILRRDVGTVGVADLLVMVLIADAAQNAMAGDSYTLADGALLVATLAGWNLAFDTLAWRFPAFARFAQPRALPLVRDGKPLDENLRRQLLTHDELMSKLREQGVDDLARVRLATLEPGGSFSVLLGGPPKTRPARHPKAPGRPA
jgi:uncharacterized membrane protein YcaP (DUF421 family)